MKIEINTDEGVREVTLKNPKGRHTKKGLKLLMAVQKGDDEDANLEALDKYMDYLDEVTAEMTGLSVEELDNFENDEKNKLVSFYQEKVESRVDFLKSSLKQPSSVQKTEAESLNSSSNEENPGTNTEKN